MLTRRLAPAATAVFWVAVFFILTFLIRTLLKMQGGIYMQMLVNGLSLGSMYALIAIGYTMVYGILRMINFAHGDIFMMACYFIFYGVTLFMLPWYIAFPAAILVTAVLGAIIERFAYRPLRNAPKNSILISAIGVSFLLENLATYIFSGVPKDFPNIAVFSGTFNIAGIMIDTISAIIPFVTVALLIILLYLINHTKTGMAMRAVSKDFEIAKVMGVPINRIITSTFVVGSSIAAIGAFMWGVKYPGISPMMGVMPGLKCFIAAVIGGIGNIKGAVVGGLLLGFGEIVIVSFFPQLSGYRDAFAFVILIIILLSKPTGLLGEKATEKV